jgi:hypothetical protein
VHELWGMGAAISSVKSGVAGKDVGPNKREVTP